MHLTLYLFALWFILLKFRTLFAFNIEHRRYVTHTGPVGSKFGFSLAQHKDSEGIWLLVGAPEAETFVPGVKKGGAVFQCDVSTENACEVIPFDTKGNHHDGTQYMDDKSNQWFGASVASRSGVVAACAPRYVWYSVKKNRREPIGGCFLLTKDRGPNRFKAYSPCMTNFWGYHRQGTCQAGFGVALSKSGSRLYVGAVGSWYWQGQVFYQNLLNMQEKLATSEAPKEFDMSYMGFSIATGNFDQDTEEDIAVGVPRGNELKGMVVLFDYKLQVLYNITGDQVGSYFGYSVAVLDADGDSRDDVAIGAPWYSQHHQSIYEEGLITVFRHTKQHNFRFSTEIHGQKLRSHFGLSLASLKDLNGDGFDDLAVGAPQDGEEGRGAVYIFLGSTDGITARASQIIYAEDLTNQPVTTFGWSITGGYDTDNNLYPDMAVGAQESGKAFIFRTRPVVEVDASVKIKSGSGFFDLESLDCVLQDNTVVSCYPISVCVTYRGKGVPPQMKFYSTLRLDTRITGHGPRLFFLKQEGKSITNFTLSLHKEVQECRSHHIYAFPDVHDKLTALVSEYSVSVLETKDSSQLLHLDPVLAPQPFGTPSVVNYTIYFQNNCGDDNICFPDLVLKANLDAKKHILGSVNNIPLDFRVMNRGEDAFLTRTYIEVPSGIYFRKFLVTYNGSPELVTPLCTKAVKKQNRATEQEDESTDDTIKEKLKRSFTEIVCELGNPLPAGSGVGIKLHLQPASNITDLSPLVFRINVNSTNEELKGALKDNEVNLILPVQMKSDVNIRGISWPEDEFTYNSTFFGENLLGPYKPFTHESEIGPAVTHIYDVINRGPSDLQNVEIYLLWPTRTLVGDPLLYLLATPSVTPSSILCDPVPDVNYLGLTVVPQSDVISGATVNPLHTLNESDWHGRRVRNAYEETYPVLLMSDDLNEDVNPRAVTNRLRDLLSCGSTNCTIMKCSTPFIEAGSNFFVKVRSRLWVDTIEKLGITNLKISSRLVVHSSVDVTDNLEDEIITTWSDSVTSVVKTRADMPVSSHSWLIWLGSIVVGLLVLALLILLLWLLGFFKRRRPQDESESELLHRNTEANGKL